MDQLESIKKWKNWKTLTTKHNIIIFPRPQLSENIETYVKRKLNLKKIPSNILIAHTKNLVQIEISSTIIRDRVKHKKTIKNMVPEKIERYIYKNNLYE